MKMDMIIDYVLCMITIISMLALLLYWGVRAIDARYGDKWNREDDEDDER